MQFAFLALLTTFGLFTGTSESEFIHLYFLVFIFFLLFSC